MRRSRSQCCLVGALVATSVAQAQSSTGVPAKLDAVAPATASQDILVYKVSGHPELDTDAPITGPGDITAALVVEAVSETDAAGNPVATPASPFTAEYADAVTSATDHTQFDRITVSTGAAPTAGHTYKVKFTATYDSNLAAAAVDDATTTNINEAGTNASAVDDDLDGKYVTEITISVPRIVSPLQFQVQEDSALKGEVISAVGNDRILDPLAFEIENMGGSTATVTQDETTVTQIKFELTESGDKVIVKSNDNALGDLGGTANTNNATVTISRPYYIDLGVTGTAARASFPIPIEANVEQEDALDWMGALAVDARPTATTTMDGISQLITIVYQATIPETLEEGGKVLAYDVSGKADPVALRGGIGTENENVLAQEEVSGIIGNNPRFRVNNATRSIEYTGNGDLDAGAVYTLRLTASGDTGLANRYVVGYVQVTVADVDSKPTGPNTASYTIAEKNKDNDPADGLIDAGEDGVRVADLDGLVSDEETAIEYKNPVDGSVPDSAAPFEIRDKTELYIKSNFNIGDITPAMVDDPATAEEEDEEDADPPDGSTCTDADAPDGCGDIQYVFKLTASDGVASNDKTLTITVTIDVNQQVAAVAAADLPSGVTYNATTKTYEVTLTDPITRGDRRVDVFDLDTILTGITDEGDVVTYTLSERNLADIENQRSMVRLNDVPAPAGDATELELTFTATIDDNFNTTTDADDDDEADAELKIQITVQVDEPAPQEYPTVDISIDEDVAVDTVVELPAAAVIDGAANYTLAGGSAGWDTNFDVDETSGAITVKLVQDHETQDNYSLTIQVKDADDNVLGNITARIAIVDVNEAPKFATASSTADVFETAQVGDKFVVTDSSPAVDLTPVTATDEDAGDTITYSIQAGTQFAVNASTAELTVASVPLQAEGALPIDIVVTATDAAGLTATHTVTATIVDENEKPFYTFPTGTDAEKTIPESMMYAAGPIFTFTAEDPDSDVIIFSLREAADKALFTVENTKQTATGYSAELKVKEGVSLDYDTDAYNKDSGYRVEVEAEDPDGLAAVLLLTVKLQDLNDEPTVFVGAPPASLQVQENTTRGVVLGSYPATDADGVGTITYSLTGTSADQFSISDTGNLMTLASLDFDSNVPCGTSGCSLTVVADDGEPTTAAASQAVTITVTSADDSISTLAVSKANPVPGESQGDANTALADVKTTAAGQTKVQERPSDLPATGTQEQSNTVKFVSTEWANWGTVLRIEVTAQSPDANCDGGNRCVVVKVEGDSSDDILQLKAYRSSTQENRFVAAFMPVSGENDMVETVVGKDSTGAENPPIYKHTDGTVARLKVDEEDKIKVEFGNLRGSVEVENEVPEIDNFLPAHEAATDDGDVDYEFTVTDDISGMPDVEDLPNDADDEYIAVVALVSGSQCHTRSGRGLTAFMTMSDGVTIYCPGTPVIREIIDDNDFDEIDNGYQVETTVVLNEGKHFVTFIACDKAGNCSAYDPEQTKHDETLPEITVDTVDPEMIEARTGVKWNTTDNEYDDDRTFIQVIFREQTALNPDTIEADDFVVEGHTIKKVYWYDPDDEDRPWADDKASTTPTRFGENSKYQTLEYTVFIELEDELSPDETPDVALVPNGIEDKAGNEQDDGEEEADDWIAPQFAILNIASPREAPESAVLAGEDDEVTFTVTVDERIKATRPDISVNYVNAKSVATKGTETCDDGTTSGGTRARGEIITPSGDCLDSGEATGGSLSVKIEKVSNTEWTATVDEPANTGYYNIYVSATDRSSQTNPGDEGVAPAKIVTDFFKGNGDVDSDDAIYFEGDIVLNDPAVRVSGVSVVDDSEPTVELKTPLFIEFDFSSAEGSEYAEDSFDFVQITKFTLDGVDMTDSVKTTDDETFLVALTGLSASAHEIEVQAVDRAGNELNDDLEIDFEVEERDPFDKRLDPGWNLVSLPGEPADSSIATVFGSDVDVKTVYTYDPVVPGGWLVAVRESLTSDWQGDLTDITAKRGYWVLSDAIQDWEVSIPRLAGGAVDSGTPIQPPVIPMYAGWNLVPVIDVTGDKLDDSDTINAQVYLNSLDDGLDLARVLGFNTITNQWNTLPVGENASDVSANLNIGSAYWVFVRESASLVPGGN